jgi:hypothetical protein
MLLAVSAHEGFVLRQCDICTVFLNGVLEEEVYVHPAFGAETLAEGESKVLRLLRALYGLRQAPRPWSKSLERDVKNRGFVRSESDPSLWLLYS